jgi:hypothetical protein
MRRSRIPILQRTAQIAREGTILDVHRIVDSVAHEFPEVPRERPLRIVPEEAVLVFPRRRDILQDATDRSCRLA